MSTRSDYKNQTIYNRAVHNEENPYKCISAVIYQDDKLGSDEIAIMVALLSNADHFIIHKKEIGKRLKLGYDRLNNAWKLLMELGYIQKELLQGGTNWIINENPENLTMPDFDDHEFTVAEFTSRESTDCDSTESENRDLTSTNSKQVLKKTNIKNKLPSLDSEGKSDPGSIDLPPKKSYSYSGLTQQFRGHLGVSSKPINGFDKDVSVGDLKPVDQPKNKDIADQFEEWYESYPSRGFGQKKGNRRKSEERFKKLSDSQVVNLIKATKILKFINVPDDPKYYSYSEKFILDFQDVLDANPIDIDNRNIDNGSGSFSV